MKKTFNYSLAILVCCFSLSFASAQEPTPRVPAWVSSKGYWVVESNLNSPLQHVVRFYNNQRQLLYTENLRGVKLDPKQRKVKMKLKKVLESTVANWEIRKIAEEDKAYVARQLK